MPVRALGMRGPGGLPPAHCPRNISPDSYVLCIYKVAKEANLNRLIIAIFIAVSMLLLLVACGAESSAANPSGEGTLAKLADNL